MNAAVILVKLIARVLLHKVPGPLDRGVGLSSGAGMLRVMSGLTVTSYAILGLLAARPWSAHELTRHMQGSNLRSIWPRAVSKLYEEPKKLRMHGLAVSEQHVVKGRKRTVYSITEEGRRALRDWLDQPSAGLVTEFEALLKVSYATEGSVEQLVRTLAGVRAQLLDSVPSLHERVDERLEDGFAVPERVHTSALILELLNRLQLTVAAWSVWAENEIQGWSDTQIDAEKAARAREVWLGLSDQLEGIESLLAQQAERRAK